MADADEIAELKKLRKRLREALLSGALSVRHGDKQVMYRSVDELKKAIASLDDELRTLEGRRRKRITYVDARRGYE